MLRYILIIKKWAPRLALLAILLAIMAGIYATTTTTPRRGYGGGLTFTNRREAISAGGGVFVTGYEY